LTNGQTRKRIELQRSIKAGMNQQLNLQINLDVWIE